MFEQFNTISRFYLSNRWLAHFGSYGEQTKGENENSTNHLKKYCLRIFL